MLGCIYYKYLYQNPVGTYIANIISIRIICHMFNDVSNLSYKEKAIIILFLTVKAAPHEYVTWTGLP